MNKTFTLCFSPSKIHHVINNEEKLQEIIRSFPDKSKAGQLLQIAVIDQSQTIRWLRPSEFDSRFLEVIDQRYNLWTIIQQFLQVRIKEEMERPYIPPAKDLGRVKGFTGSTNLF